MSSVFRKKVCLQQTLIVDGGFWERLVNVFPNIVYLFPLAHDEAWKLMASIVLVTTNSLFITMNNVMKSNY